MKRYIERHPVIATGIVAAVAAGGLALSRVHSPESDGRRPAVAAPSPEAATPALDPTLSPSEQVAREKQEQHDIASWKAQAQKELVDGINEPSVVRLVKAIGELPVSEQMDILIDKACSWRTVHYNAWAAGYAGRPYTDAIDQTEGYYSYLYVKQNNEWEYVNDGGRYDNYAIWQERQTCPEAFGE